MESWQKYLRPLIKNIKLKELTVLNINEPWHNKPYIKFLKYKKNVVIPCAVSFSDTNP